MTTAPTDSIDLAKVAARAADDKQGTNTTVISVGHVLAITELFVITGAPNRRLVRAIADDIEEKVREATGRSPIRVEGHREQQWILVDYGDVIVHVFLQETRDFYEIERLYKDAPRIEWRD
ncbi:MAG: ribosome silencing factor [Acidimicrobiales bacterium mtb01]|nr:ribosome silencing factor [Actinomycetota bacterium]TEX45526.1 MAG: ribosome silencing factor [Acidimicrobiales bacterium mtb01]